MGKRILISMLVSALINAAGSFANFMAFRQTNHLLLGFRQYGGEIMVEQGFGTIVSHIYPMTPDKVTTHHFHFSILMFAIWTLAMGIIVFLLLTVIGKVKGKR